MNNRQIDRRQFVRGGSMLVAAAAAGNVMAMQQSKEQPAASQENGTPYLAGVKSAVITPEEPIPMAGFGSRGDKPSEGVYQDLLVKTLVLADKQGKPNRLVIVTADLVAWSGRMIAEIRKKLKDRLGLGPESIMPSRCANASESSSPRVGTPANPHDVPNTTEARSVFRSVTCHVPFTKPSIFSWARSRTIAREPS